MNPTTQQILEGLEARLAALRNATTLEEFRAVLGSITSYGLRAGFAVELILSDQEAAAAQFVANMRDKDDKQWGIVKTPANGYAIASKPSAGSGAS